MASEYGPVNSFLQQVSGRNVTTDFLIDYASARALLDREDPYGIAAEIIDSKGLPAWPVSHANPHPPTMVSLAAPFALLSYQNALAAWSVLMVFALIGTICLIGVRLPIAIAVGLGIAITYPGAWGIGNAVPLIGFGVAVAYKYRNEPILAAVGLTLAAAPKISGLLLLLPFLLTLRIKALAWAAAMVSLLAVFPLMFFGGAWSRYLHAGAHAIRVNAERQDNASVLNLAHKHEVPQVLVAALLVAVAVSIAIRIKDSWWPSVWLIVAALPIAWMYSMLTLIPLFCATVRSRSSLGVGSVFLASALIVGSVGGMWPTRAIPLIIALAAVGLTQIDDDAFRPNKASLLRAIRWKRQP